MTIPSSQERSRPAYRLLFSVQTGTDKNGQPTLSYPIEIGAAFHRREAEKGLIAKFRILPTELKEGVLFLAPVNADRSQGELL